MDETRRYLSYITPGTLKPDKRRKHDAACRAEALRPAEPNRSTQAAARSLNLDPKRIYTVAESRPNIGGDRVGRGSGPDHGRRIVPAASR